MAEQPQDNQEQASRGDNAKRYGMIGMLLGAVMGLVKGGGIAGMVQMGLLAGGAAAVGGAVAGNKLNPLTDKIMGMIPGLKGKAQSKEAPAPQMEPQLEHSTGPVFREVTAIQEVPTQGAAIEQENFRAVESIDPAVLAGARAQAGTSMDTAREGMAADAKAMSASRLPEEWVSSRGAKAPTHEGPAMRQ